MSPAVYLSPKSYTGSDGSFAGKRSILKTEKVTAMYTIAATLVGIGLAPEIGVPEPSLVFAAWANAWGESGFDTSAWRAEPDGRVSYGLFQCLKGTATKRGGAGDGHAVQDLIDPSYNTRVIAGEARKAALVHTPPRDVVGLTDWWVRYVERPAKPDDATAKRVEWLRSWGGA